MFDHKAEEERIERQMADGRGIATALLSELSIRLRHPEITGFKFSAWSKGSRPDQEILIDDTGLTVTRIPIEWLQDAPASPETRFKLRARLEDAARAYFGR